MYPRNVAIGSGSDDARLGGSRLLSLLGRLCCGSSLARDRSDRGSSDLQGWAQGCLWRSWGSAILLLCS